MTSEPGLGLVLRQRLREGGIHWFHFGLGLLVLGSAVTSEFLHSPDWRVKLSYAALLFYLAFVVVSFGVFVHKYARKSRYAEAMLAAHAVIHEIRNAAWQLDQVVERGGRINAAEFSRSVQIVLDAASKAFTLVSGTYVRACIKVLGGPSSALHVRTFARDSVSASRCAEDDRDEGSNHLVDSNTDFHLIVRGKQRFYFNNDLSRRNDDYRNSKVPGGTGTPENYKATIVFPIRYALSENDACRWPDMPRISIVGFLAIDSQARGAFSRRYDVEMGAVIADALFVLLDRWEMLSRTRSAEPTASNRSVDK